MADKFGDRMKEYEAVSDFKLTKKIPIIIRLDGNSFSKFTKQMKFKKPFDSTFYSAMCYTVKELLKYCSGAQLGYTQSDEITLFLRNDQTPDTEAFLGNRLEKLCSLLASKASVEFSNYLNNWYIIDRIYQGEIGKKSIMDTENFPGLTVNATFDCRVFLVPPTEVNNAFLWRQQDAFKNCCQGVLHYGLRDKYGRKAAQKMMHGLSNSQQQEMIFQELGINMNDYPTKYKRGVCVVRKTVETPIEKLMSKENIEKFGKQGEIVQRSVWTVDEEIPRFNQDPNYVNKYLGDKSED